MDRTEELRRVTSGPARHMAKPVQHTVVKRERVSVDDLWDIKDIYEHQELISDITSVCVSAAVGFLAAGITAGLAAPVGFAISGIVTTGTTYVGIRQILRYKPSAEITKIIRFVLDPKNQHERIILRLTYKYKEPSAGSYLYMGTYHLSDIDVELPHYV